MGMLWRVNDYLRVQKRYSAAERARILADYHASCSTQREFAGKAGISLACLSIWLRRERHQLDEQKRCEPSGVFVPVQMKGESDAPPAHPVGVEIELLGKMLVRLPQTYSQADAVRFILQLRQAC